MNTSFAMKILTLIILPLSIVLAYVTKLKTVMTEERPVVSKNADIAMCASPAGTLVTNDDGKYIAALKGWGDLNYKISAANDSAQFYFNQGLGFYYGYHFTESLASFKEASKFDPSSPMTYWGQALAMGPFYNTYSYKMKKEVPEVVAEMIRHSSNSSPKEKDLVAALQKRYSNDMTNADRKELDRNYALALAALMKKYPDDNDIKALYVDAIMLEHKWDFYGHDGSYRSWTKELVSICEQVLKKEEHPAILHYYIHVTEASTRPDQALKAADALKDKIPGIGHMVHMASHMYQRNGLYVEGVKINDEANAVNNVLDDKAPNLKLGKDRSPHFFAVQSFCAMSAGMYKEGVHIYDRARERQLALTTDMRSETYSQFVYMMPVMARVRLGKWDEILKALPVDATWSYAFVLDQFARGVAYIRTNDVKAAEHCLGKIKAAMQDSVLAIRLMPFNSPLQSCRIAESILTGEILFKKGQTKKSFEAFQSAIDEEEKMVYREPHDWLIPARQFLGAYLLKNNQPKEAEKVYQHDLVKNPNNGWSLVGMYQSLKAQNKLEDANVYKEKYEKAFENADVNIISSVF